MTKINNNYLFNPSIKQKKTNKNKKTHNSGGISSFNNILQQNTIENQLDKTSLEPGSVSENEISLLLKDVGIQGKALKRQPNLEEFDKYRRLVGQLLSKILKESESVHKKEVRNFFKKEKVTKIHLKVVNQELLELTDLFMKGQKDIIKIAGKIDKIEGILIDTCS